MKKYIFILILFFNLIPHFISCETLNKMEINDLFNNGKQYFQKGNELAEKSSSESKRYYQKAAMHLKKIINDGNIKNGKLYYNLGNIYFRMDDIGNAILNYRKALQYIPNDTNLQQNLKFARTSRKDQFEEIQKTKILKTLFFWHYDISNHLRIMFFISFFLLFWLFALIRIFRKHPITKWGMFITLILSILFGISLIAEEISIHRIIPGVIISPEIIARKGNSSTYEPTFKEPIHSGTEFNLIEQRQKWYYIKLLDSRTCWIPKTSAKLIKEEETMF